MATRKPSKLTQAVRSRIAEQKMPVKSVEKTGGNVNYYMVNIADPKRLTPYQAECEDIIEALGMTFAEGCLFKALWRSCAARTLGLHKEGQDAEGIYDAEKAIYYSNRVLAVRKRLKKS